MQISELANKSICIWGFGREGQASLKQLQSVPGVRWSVASDEALSSSEHSLAESLGVTRIAHGADSLQLLCGSDIVLVSPGISAYREDFQTVLKSSARITTGTNLWLSKFAHNKIIAVTGTKGKSTTSALIKHLAQAAGLRVRHAGNIGIALMEYYWEAEPVDLWVLELSSYQCSTLQAEISAAVLLNLYPEHLNWHGDFTRYCADKARLLAAVPPNGQIFIRSQEAKLLTETDIRCSRINFIDQDTEFEIRNRSIFSDGTRLCELPLDLLPGQHNMENIKIALVCLQRMQLLEPGALHSILNFTPLPHRLQKISQYNEVLYVDDSISTIPQTSLAGVRAFAPNPVTLIAGGFDRGVEWTDVARDLLVSNLEQLILIGQNSTKIQTAFNSAQLELGKRLKSLQVVDSLEAAVNLAKAISPPGGIVLLSPGAPSYGMYKDFAERGRSFQTVVSALTDKLPEVI